MDRYSQATDAPLVSVVTPSFNQGRFLRRTIESVLCQDYPRIEYLVIDGGSRDDSRSILEAYGERFYWVCEPDRGQSHAINKGLERAKGEIFAYLNSDDVLLPGAITAAVRTFLSAPTCDVVYGDAFWIDEHDRFLGRYPTAPFQFGRLLEGCFICQPATLWRRRIGEAAGAFDESLHFAMDFDYWLRLAKAGGRFHWLRRTLACSRLHAHTKTLAGRDGVLGEVYQASMRHTGQAGFSNYLAYWQRRTQSGARGWPRLLSRVPDAGWWLALLNSRWDKSGRRLTPWCAALVASLARNVRRL